LIKGCNRFETTKKCFLENKIFGQKLKFLAHSGGWIVLKIIL
jgi:hypothetical protein